MATISSTAEFNMIIGAAVTRAFEDVIDKAYRELQRHVLSDIYSASDVFVNLTHADTLPTVNMESICSGTPVITFDCAGSPELVDSDSGIAVPEGDFEGIVNAIRYIKDKGLSFDITEKQNKFDKNKNYSKYLKIYKNMQTEYKNRFA